MPNIDLSILNQRQTPAFYADTLANRPAAGFVGRIFVSTDTYAFYRDNGTSWDLIGGPGTGTITGSGSSGSLALWNGTNTITYDVNITWNGTDNSISADKFIVNSGTSSQFLKGDGSLDSSAYVTTNIYNGNGTLSGERTISLNGNNLIFDGGASIARVRLDADTNVARIFSFATNNVARWAFRIDDAETGSNAGSNFAVRRYNDAGTFVDAPLLINRATGQSTFAKKVVIENNASDQQLQIVSTTAPSLRIDNLQTGATKRIGLGLATAVNNFIQGSVDQDFCIFNSTTVAASPILFGIYDAGLGNTQEAARISAARNLLVGTSVDGGQKLQINGTSRLSGFTFVNHSTASSYGAAIYNTNANGEGLAIRGGSTSSHSALIVQNYDGSSALFTVLATGAATFSSNVGINGVSASYPLYVRTGTNQRARFVDNGGIFQFGILNDAESSYVDLSIGNSALIVKATNNVLIGTTTDAGQKLQVSGTALISGNTSIGVATAATNLEFNLNGVSGKAQRIQFQNNGTNQWLLGAGAASETSAFELFNASGTIVISVDKTTNVTTINAPIAIGNTVTAAVGVASTHKVSILINGVQYYLLASNV